MGKLELVYDEIGDVSYGSYEENGERVEAIQIDGKFDYPEIGQRYFPEFDFYRLG